jgi:hypothetical protein
VFECNGTDCMTRSGLAVRGQRCNPNETFVPADQCIEITFDPPLSPGKEYRMTLPAGSMYSQQAGPVRSDIETRHVLYAREWCSCVSWPLIPLVIGRLMF